MVEIRHFIEEYTEYQYRNIAFVPKSYHRSVALFLVSAMLNQNVNIELVRGRVYPNIWIMLLGPPSSTKKTTAIGKGESIMPINKPSMKLEKVNIGKFTIEGIVGEFDRIANKNRDIDCYAIQDEFGQLLSLLANPKTAELKDFLCKVYDVEMNNYKLTYKNMKKVKPLQNIYMPMLVATTPARLRETVSMKEIETGIPTRFIYNYETEPSRYIPDRIPDARDNNVKQYLIDTLITIHKTYLKDPSMELHPLTLKKWNIWNEQYHKKLNHSETVLTSFASRLASTAIKISIIFAAEQGKHIITPDTFERAVKEIDYYTNKARNMISKIEFADLEESLDNKKANYILEKISQVSEIGHSDLARSARNVPAKQIKYIALDLAARGDIKIENRGRGKGGTVYIKR